MPLLCGVRSTHVRAAISLSPRAGRGWGEGRRRESELQRKFSAERRGPLNPSFSPRAGRRRRERRARFTQPRAQIMRRHKSIAEQAETSWRVKPKRWRSSRPACATRTFRRRPSPSPRPASSTPSASCCSARRCRGAALSTITSNTSAPAARPSSTQAFAAPARRARPSPTAPSRTPSSSTICASRRPACIPAPPC